MNPTKSPAPLAGGKPGTIQIHQTQASIAHDEHAPDSLLRPGTTRCRCAACGRYFGGVAGFEKHRIGGVCVEPAAAGLYENNRGYWSRPRPKVVRARGGVTGMADFATPPATGVQAVTI